MLQHIVSGLLFVAGLAAAQALSQMGAPTWLLWTTVAVFVFVAALLEMASGRVRVIGVSIVVAGYFVVAVVTMWASDPPKPDNVQLMRAFVPVQILGPNVDATSGFWVLNGKANKTAVNAALFVRVVNLVAEPRRINDIQVDARIAGGEWVRWAPILTSNRPVYIWYPDSGGDALRIDDSKTSFLDRELASFTLQANDSAEGWLLAAYPQSVKVPETATTTTAEFRFTLLDVTGQRHVVVAENGGQRNLRPQGLAVIGEREDISAIPTTRVRP